MPSKARPRWAGRAGIRRLGRARATPSRSRLPTPPSWMTCRTAPPRPANPGVPGQAGLSYGAGLSATFKTVAGLHACTIALDARENTLDAVGSLMEILARGRRELARGAFNYDPLGVLAKTGTLYYPPGAPARWPLAADCRTMSHVTALIADGRPYHEAGASEGQELRRPCWRPSSPTCAPARRRGCARAWRWGPRGGAGGGCRPVPHHGQARARGAPAGGARGGGFGAARRRKRCNSSHTSGA